MRIYIIGQSGSGKTTLASKLSQKLNIPHIELDTIWHKYSGHREHFKKEVFEKIQTKDWIVDGKHKTVRKELIEMADLIIYCDFSLSSSVLNNLKRSVKQKEPALKFLRHLLKVIWEFHPTRIMIRAELDAHKGKVKILKTFKEVEMVCFGYSSRR